MTPRAVRLLLILAALLPMLFATLAARAEFVLIERNGDTVIVRRVTAMQVVAGAVIATPDAIFADTEIAAVLPARGSTGPPQPRNECGNTCSGWASTSAAEPRDTGSRTDRDL